MQQSPYEKSKQHRVTDKVQKQLQSEQQTWNVKIDTILTFSNPLHAKWITSFYDVIKNNKHMPRMVGKDLGS